MDFVKGSENILTLTEILDVKASSTPDKPFLYTPGKVFTFKQVKEYSLSIGLYLIERGMKQGDRIVIISSNSPQFIFSFFGILYAGGIPVPLNYFLEEEIGEILMEVSPAFILLSKEFLSKKQVFEKDFSGEILTLEEIPLQKRKKLQQFSTSEEAVILYTSGTSGFPRGVVLTHRNLISDVEACLKRIRVFTNDRFSLILPLFHSFSLTACLLTPLYRGTGVVMAGDLQQFDRVMETILQNKTSIFIAIPKIFYLLSQAKFKYLPFRFCVSGGERLSPEVEKEFEKKFKIPLLQGYGLTEASPVVSLNPEKGEKKGSVGPPLEGVAVRILKNKKEVPSGKEGEIVVEGPTVMKGYWGKSEDTRKVLEDGWLYTGDIGIMDRDGFLYIIDRKKDMVVVKGLNVYPSEVERHIMRYPGVKESAVVGVNTGRGEVLIAFVVCEKKIREEELHSFLLKHLARYKVPRRIEFLPSLPHTPSGKVKKQVLRELYSRKL